MTKVGVVILHHDGPDWTGPCLESLHKSDYPHRHLIVVDNGSRQAASFAGVETVRSPLNLGFAGGCNLGARLALERGCDAIWLLNNDTLVYPQTLSSMVRASRPDRLTGSVLLDMECPGRVQAWGGGHLDLVWGRSRHRRVPGRLDYLCGASLFVPAGLWTALGGLDEGYFLYWEDADFCLRHRRAGGVLEVAADSRLLHRGGGTSGGCNSPLFDHHFTRSSLRFFRRHSPCPPLPIGRSLLERLARRLARGRFVSVQAIVRALAGADWPP